MPQCKTWILLLVGFAAIFSMMQQTAFLNEIDHHSADWKVADFVHERAHHDEPEDTNYTWVDENRRLNGDMASKQEILGNATQPVIYDNEDEENPWMKILGKAGVDVSAVQEALLPELHRDWKELFGMEPKILGMETCATYRSNVPQDRRIVAVAGLFNTGTNAMEFHLRKNIKAPSKWQVPWGKHRDPSVRLHHVAPGMDKVEQRDVLPIVIIRDPFHWMQSMCRSPYATKWKKTKDHCPNLVPTKADIQKFKPAMKESNNTFPVTVVFSKDQIMKWDSLAHLYSAWYRQYLEADYPHIIVRFEDMLWQADFVLKQIADCMGTVLADPISYQTKASKSHGSGTDFLKAIFKSGNQTLRARNLTPEDMQYASMHFDKELMQIMNYKIN